MKLLQVFLIALSAVYTTASYALPSLQLSGDGSADWSYDTTDQTWAISETSFDLFAYANATTLEGGNGDFAWDPAGATDRYAYLIVAAVPDIGSSDSFDISVNSDGSTSIMVASGYGNPPIEDSNSISPHGIFNTYFEIYEFQFDGLIGDISDQQPGQTGSGQGYTEVFNIDINSMLSDLSGLHFDLFTIEGDGQWIPDPGGTTNKDLVNAVAPYSHDAEFKVPEPGIPALMAIGLLGFSLQRFIKSRIKSRNL